MGADFFLFGLDNLGFTVEWGLNLDTGGSPGLETALRWARRSLLVRCAAEIALLLRGPAPGWFASYA